MDWLGRPERASLLENFDLKIWHRDIQETGLRRHNC